ncbi:circadian clock protein KaiC [Falsiroseomonas selenitidurans]|uniref:non-specific serine/threonine protein kinase n=1 Tax=Falsiroseomonas selenitidurans TaxID=2716335 RepID=A0ABX1E4P3_9PROT|nr:circadian clock protein KaiC [Falsiroseomonas selenitidurans]NKC32159.1 circadian clock protein KaiC [Falsiroseomonas selenitidurans]
MAKAATGISGLDEITRGGLPTGRITLLDGGPGAGKTLLALQVLAHGAIHAAERAIFVAFEEAPDRIRENCAGFAWAGPAWHDATFFLDAQPDPDLVQAGSFDLGGLLAAIGAMAEETGARRVVFDALDVMLALLPDATARRRELHRLNHWLRARGMTAIVTAKSAAAPDMAADPDGLGFLQFMADCAISLRHELIGGVSQRSLRVLKYRGSGFAENQAPLLIGAAGIEVAFAGGERDAGGPAPQERVGSGVQRLDAMLEGGYHRGASILISGAPGTAKTTLSGAFAEAACQRGEPTLFVSFDSRAEEVERNLASVAIDLATHQRSGMLRILAARSVHGSAEGHLLRIRAAAHEQGARCLVIDPLSALAQDGNAAYSHSVAERLIDWAKAAGITLLCTSLMAHLHPEQEGTPLQVSTIADTWIHLSYLARGGERNRALTIIKSRGTGHSNQVRELLLSGNGVTLDEVYLADGEVMMGTLRWEQENAARNRASAAAAEAELQRLRLEAERAEIEGRLSLLHRQLELKQAEWNAIREAGRASLAQAARGRSELHLRRMGDAQDPPDA